MTGAAVMTAAARDGAAATGWAHAPAARRAGAPARRWRYPALLGAGTLLASAAVVLWSGADVAASIRQPYQVSVPVQFRPQDPHLWAVLNADDFDSALALDPTLPDPASIGWDDAAAAPLVPPDRLRDEVFVGPPAKSMPLRGATETDRSRAHYCLTAAVYYEAASETDDGMRGVAQTVINRVHHPSFPNTVCGVVFQGSQRAGVCQFTFSCDGAMARAPSRSGWLRASRIASEILSGKVFTPVGLATHYHTQAIWPRWGKSLVMTNIVGAHIFHRWRGRWGMPDAFRAPYAGREPVPGPYLPVAEQVAILSGRKAAAPADMLPSGGVVANAGPAAPIGAPVGAGAPAPLPSAMNAPIGTVPPARPGTPAKGAAAAPNPEYRDRSLNQSGDVREEFRGSGEWIK